MLPPCCDGWGSGPQIKVQRWESAQLASCFPWCVRVCVWKGFKNVQDILLTKLDPKIVPETMLPSSSPCFWNVKMEASEIRLEFDLTGRLSWPRA